MADPDRSNAQRISGLLIVDFRALNSSKEYFNGITFTFSPEGLDLESQNIDFNTGDVLELILKHPERDLSVPVTGKITWKKEGWYKCTAGIEFREPDSKTMAGIQDLMKVIKEGTGSYSAEKNEKEVNEEVRAGQQHVRTFSEKIDHALFKESLNSDTGHMNKPDSAQMSDKEYLTQAVDSLNDLDVTKDRDVQNENQTGGKTYQESEKRKARSWGFTVLLPAVFLLSALAFSYTGIRETVMTYVNDTQLRASIFGNPKENVLQGNEKVSETGTEPLRVENGIKGTEDAVLSEDPGFAPGQHAEEPEIAETSDTAESVPPVDEAAHEDASTDDGISPGNDIKFDITFGMDSDIVDHDFYPVLDEIADLVSHNQEIMIRIAGHTDSVGPKIYNIDLSMRRALAVKKLLNQRGVEDSRMKLEIFGDSKPKTSNATVSGRVKNRRVEIVPVHTDN